MSLPTAVTEQRRLLTVQVEEDGGLDLGRAMKMWPLLIDPANGVHTIYLRVGRGTKLPRHFHTGPVHVYTTKGLWFYDQHPEDVQSAGSYLYEPAGSVHGLTVPDDVECMEAVIVVHGANINFDDAGNYLDTTHAGSMEAAIAAVAKANGVDPPRYIRPGAPLGFSASPADLPSASQNAVEEIL